MIKKNIAVLVASITFVTFNLTGQNIIENKKIFITEEFATLDALLSQFKGNFVYIDFWASWCSPCLNELKHDTALDAFFEKNNIVRLYIAVEKRTDNNKEKRLSTGKWRTLVNKNNLTGYNYYTQNRSPFMSNVYNSVMGKLSLPRFMIVDKNGTVIVKKAKRPSQKKKLIKQLNKCMHKTN